MRLARPDYEETPIYRPSKLFVEMRALREHMREVEIVAWVGASVSVGLLVGALVWIVMTILWRR